VPEVSAGVQRTVELHGSGRNRLLRKEPGVKGVLELESPNLELIALLLDVRAPRELDSEGAFCVVDLKDRP
jgi:hypothetical protein